MQRALDLGVHVDRHGRRLREGSANERLVGQAIRARRAEIVLASKFGLVPPAGGGAARQKSMRGPSACAGCCERESAAARRRRRSISTTCTRIDPSRADRGDGRRDGRSRARGQGPLSRPLGSGPRSLRRAHRTHPIAALQSEYSLWTREPEARRVAGLPRARDRLRPVQPAGPRLPDRPRSSDIDTLSANDVRRKMPRFQAGELSRRT